jgi:hypothetical protein
MTTLGARRRVQKDPSVRPWDRLEARMNPLARRSHASGLGGTLLLPSIPPPGSNEPARSPSSRRHPHKGAASVVSDRSQARASPSSHRRLASGLSRVLRFVAAACRGSCEPFGSLLGRIRGSFDPSLPRWTDHVSSLDRAPPRSSSAPSCSGEPDGLLSDSSRARVSRSARSEVTSRLRRARRLRRACPRPLDSPCGSGEPFDAPLTRRPSPRGDVWSALSTARGSGGPLARPVSSLGGSGEPSRYHGLPRGPAEGLIAHCPHSLGIKGEPLHRSGLTTSLVEPLGAAPTSRPAPKSSATCIGHASDSQNHSTHR